MVRPRVTAWPEDALIPPAQGRKALEWLAHATQQYGDALNGHLHAHQMVIDPQGVTRIAPTGIPAAHSLADVAITRRQTSFGTPNRDALFGLGVLLFGSLTGRAPFEGDTPNKLAKSQENPLKLMDLMPAVETWDPEPLQRLLTKPDIQTRPDPMIDQPWIPTFNWPAEPEPILNPTSMEAELPNGTPTENVHHRWLVVAELENTTLVARRRLAALAQLPTIGLQGTNESPVGGGHSEQDAIDLVETLSVAGVPLHVVSNRSGTRNLFFGIAGAAASLLATAAGMGIGLLMLPSIPALLGTTAIVAPMMGWSAWQIWRGFQQNASNRRIQRTHLLASEQREPIPIGTTRSVIGQTRRAVLQGDLPQIAVTDLLQALDDLEDALEGLQQTNTDQLNTLSAAATAIRHSISLHEPRTEWNDAPLRRAHLVAKAMRRTRHPINPTG